MSPQEKVNIRTLLKTINSTGTTLLDNGDGTMYLLDHTDREGIENRNPKKEDGFNCRLKLSTDGYTKEEIRTIKDEIENGNIRNQKDFNRWASNHPKGQRGNNSDSIVTEVRKSNADNAGLYSEAQQREPFGGRSNSSSSENLRKDWIKVPSDGTRSPRYIQIDSSNEVFFLTPSGEVYGFVAPNGDIYLDETKISPEHPIHEYTHLWDRIVAKKNPWEKCMMKSTAFYQTSTAYYWVQSRTGLILPNKLDLMIVQRANTKKSIDEVKLMTDIINSIRIKEQ